MEHTFWHKQTKDKPLFPDMLWSRPQNKRHAGKLLIIGGNVHSFAAVAEAYQHAQAAGAGTVRVLLPDALKKTVGKLLENLEFAPSTPSGSFSQKALAEAISLAKWADGVLLAGDLGRNSETAILIENLLGNFRGLFTLTQDSIDYIISNSRPVEIRSDTTLVVTMTQLQHLVTKLKCPQAITLDMSLNRLVDLLHDFTQVKPLNIIVKYENTVLVAVDGQISTTKMPEGTGNWSVKTAATASVWWAQNPTKPFEALTTTAYEIMVAGEGLAI